MRVEIKAAHKYYNSPKKCPRKPRFVGNSDLLVENEDLANVAFITTKILFDVSTSADSGPTLVLLYSDGMLSRIFCQL